MPSQPNPKPDQPPAPPPKPPNPPDPAHAPPEGDPRQAPGRATEIPVPPGQPVTEIDTGVGVPSGR